MDSANLLQRLLTLYGYDATIAPTAASAIELASREQFRLLICDVSLPDGDGCSVFQAVGRLYPVIGIALTGHALEDQIKLCMDAGFSAHLVKPIDFSLLKKALDALCGPSHAVA